MTLELLLQILVFPALGAIFMKLDSIGNRLTRLEVETENLEERLTKLESQNEN